jgi:FkbM family methyltransferase
MPSDGSPPPGLPQSSPLLRGGFPLLVNRLRARLFRKLVRDIAEDRRGLPHLPIIPGDMVSEISFVDGLHEIGDIALVAELVQRGTIQRGVALDIGANIGNHTLAFARVFDEVIAFEPFAASCHLLRAALALNGASHVTVVETALGATKGQVELHRPGRDLGGIAASQPVAAGAAPAIAATLMRGDDWLARERPDIASGAARITFVKLDVEGFEADVIAGLSEMFARHTPVLMIESLESWAFERFAAVLRPLGYQHFQAMRPARGRGWPARLLAPSGRMSRLEPLSAPPQDSVNVLASTTPLT